MWLWDMSQWDRMTRRGDRMSYKLGHIILLMLIGVLGAKDVWLPVNRKTIYPLT